MKIGTIVQTNQKGQIVIPYKVRKKLGINEDSSLNLLVRDGYIVLYNINELTTTNDSSTKDDFVDNLLKQTLGAWSSDDLTIENEKKYREKIESETLKKLREKAW